MNQSITAIAHTQEIPPGNMKRVRYNNKTLLIINLDNQFYAIDELCPHEDVSLSNGFLVGDKIQCPLHGSQFCIKTGKVQCDPAEEDLQIYPLEIKGDMIYTTTIHSRGN